MRRLIALAAVAGAALVMAGVGNAGRDQQSLTCTGGVGTIAVTVTSTKSDHSVAWGVATASSSLHVIPVSFSGAITDLTTNTVLDTFFQAKGQGNGMQNQMMVSCTTPPEIATAGDLGGIPGIADGDLIQLAFTAQAVLKP